MGNGVFSFLTPKMNIKSPIIVILGCTGSGKSKLAIELAKKFNGEIISADSMQVYKGLDIVTNKVSVEEQQEAVHHFINCVDPLSRYTVVDFRNKALPLIDNLLKQKKLPIIVGGTNYYIESLLWDVLIKPDKTEEGKLLNEYEESYEKVDPLTLKNTNFTEHDLLKRKFNYISLKSVSNAALHDLLYKIDREMANALHPQDRRKVIRSLQVYQQHGCKHSDLLLNQRSQSGGSSLGGPLRFKNSVMLWLQCDKEALEERLDKRLELMLQNGLIDELLTFHRLYNEERVDSGSEPCYTEGIFQSIGFKEFHNFLILSNEEQCSTKGQAVKQQAVEEMKLVTKRYARKQVKWIVNRFLRNSNRQIPPIYGLNATDTVLWQTNVLDPAVQIVQSTIKNENPTIPHIPIEEGLDDDKKSYFCETCNKSFLGKRTYGIHMNSRKHSKRKVSIMKGITAKKKELNTSME